MRLAKSVKVALGIVVSGSAAFILSGSAFAAESGVSTTSENVTTNVVRNVEETSVSGKGVVNEATPPVSTITKKVVEIGSKTETPGATKDNADTVGQSPAVPVEAVAKPLAGAAVVASGQSDAPAAKTDAVISRVEASAEKTGNGASVVEANTAAPAVDAGGTPEVVSLGQSVVFRSTVLPIQPKITNTRPVLGDLAAMVPSAPAQQQNPAKAPTPSQPSGLFGRFAAELAGIVVPEAFWLSLLGLVKTAAQGVVVVAFALLFLGLVGLTFGAWLRRGGYAHAARSDVADDGATIFFATPFRLGYVSALQPPHNPFLMVADTKTVLSTVCNAFRKEEMR